MTKKGKLFAKNGEEWVEIGGGDENALPKTGGAMTGYLSDKTALQVRNVMTATEKPADAVGKDGDVCVIPGASGGGGGVSKADFDALAERVTALENIPNANGRLY